MTSTGKEVTSITQAMEAIDHYFFNPFTLPINQVTTMQHLGKNYTLL